MEAAERMSVLQVGASDAGGGAERVMMDLHAEWLRRGLDAWVAVGFKRTDDPRVLAIPNDSERSGWARGLGRASARIAAKPGAARRTAARALLLASAPRRYAAVLAGREDMSYPGTARLLDLPPEPPDVLHLHNLHGGYFDLRQLPSLAARAPMLITMHDAWLLTGHCAHPFGCERWRTGCGTCPTLGTPIAVRRDATKANRDLKRRMLEQARPVLVSPSRWLMRMVEEAGLAESCPTRVIPNGVDTALFSPGDRSEARAALGLPPQASIVLIAGRELQSNAYKDYATLVAAVPALTERTRGELIVVALGSTRSDELASATRVVNVPFAEPSTVVSYLRAADVYVHPAKAENLPLAIIEAMACGVPVVASAVGGIPELVDDGRTGLLVPPNDAEALAAALTKLLDDDALRSALSTAVRDAALSRFTHAREADTYLELYRELHTTRRARR